MPQTRPIECPACGYERIQRSTSSPPSSEKPSERGERWACRLCAYEWSVRSRAVVKDDWVPA
jgi:transposase-like protein